MRFVTDDKYFKNNIIYNEEFGEVLDFAIDIILKQKIKTFYFGNYFQYSKFEGKLKAYMVKKRRHNNKSLMLKGNGFEIECLTEYWDSITIKRKGIDIEEVGIYFEFENSIWSDYKKLKKRIESLQTKKS